MGYRTQFWEYEQTGDDKLIERLEKENSRLKAERDEMKHAIQMHADLLNVNEEHLQKLLIQSDRELQQVQQRAARLREALNGFMACMTQHGEWEDSCFYYNGHSATELRRPIEQARELLKKEQS